MVDGERDMQWENDPSRHERDRAGRRVLVIVNPAAGRWRLERLRAVLGRLGELACASEIRTTTGRGDAERFARQALGEGFDVVVAAGGDGTVNEVINGLAGSDQPLALLPLGTVNVLAAEIGLPNNPRAIAEVIAGGRPAPIYLGRAGPRHFVLMAGVGLDAHVVAGVSLRLKRLLGQKAYYASFFNQLLIQRKLQYRVTIDGAVHQAASVIVANSRFYGGRFVCAPQADLTAPLLQVCLFERPGRWNALRYVLALYRGRVARLNDCRIIPATALTIEGPTGDPAQMDGDIDARLPLTIRVAERPLRLIRP